jgi:hypothetical protein
MLDLLEWVFLAFAVFRFTRLLVYDTITAFIRSPFHEIKELRDENGQKEKHLYIKGTGLRFFIGSLLSCHWCTGMWSAMVLYGGYILWPGVFSPVIMVLGLAGAASIIEEGLQRFM